MGQCIGQGPVVLREGAVSYERGTYQVDDLREIDLHEWEGMLKKEIELSLFFLSSLSLSSLFFIALFPLFLLLCLIPLE